LSTDIGRIIKDALEVQCEAFTQLTKDATQLLCDEDGNVGNLSIKGRLVKINPSGQALIVGDLHGDLESLIDILKKSNYLQKLNSSQDTYLIFLGDYGDRGVFSAEVYYVVMKLKLLFPEQVVMMRGNHEGPPDLMARPHDLPLQFQRRFGKNWWTAYAAVRRILGCLYTVVLVEGCCLLIHGGLPRQVDTIEDLVYAHSTYPQRDFLEDMLWSDPDETIEETSMSPRGAGKLFGRKVTERILGKLGAGVLIRGHEPCQDGFKINHNGKVLTVFSRKGPPYFNAYGAYLDMDLSEKLEDASQLISRIHKF
jgi:protein phosphatase